MNKEGKMGAIAVDLLLHSLTGQETEGNPESSGSKRLSSARVGKLNADSSLLTSRGLVRTPTPVAGQSRRLAGIDEANIVIVTATASILMHAI
jgi:hypothetical protein